MDEGKGVVRMTDIERRINALERDIARRKKEMKAIERAQSIGETEFDVKEVQKTFYEVNCGNCKETLCYSETFLLTQNRTWYFCPFCGVRLKKRE